MKKARVVLSLTVSSSAVLIEGLVRNLAKDYDVHIISSPGYEMVYLARNENATFHPIGMKRNPHIFHDFISILKIFVLLLRLKPVLLFSSTPKAGFLFTFAGFFLRIPIRIYHIRGLRYESFTGFKKKFFVLIEKCSSFFATHVTCLCRSIYDQAILDNLSNSSKLSVIGPGGSGTILNRFGISSDNSLRSDIGLPPKINVVGFVGRLIERKGIKDLLDVWSQITIRYPYSRLLLIGDFDDSQPLPDDLLFKIRSDSSIIHIGHIDNQELYKYYSLMDVFVSPAYWEGFGNVYIEAAASGVPVVGYDVNGVKDAISNGFNGVLVERCNIEQLANAIEVYLSDPLLRKQHGLNGIIWSKKFDREIVSDHWSSFFSLLLLAYTKNHR